MRILITGVCGFVGSTLAREFVASGHEVVGLDNLIRAGSELNRRELSLHGVKLVHGDLRVASDLEMLPRVDWVIDAAANPSVLAGVDGKSSSRQLVEHNLWGTVNLLELCKRDGAGFILLSTSRVYSIPPLAALNVRVVDDAFVPDAMPPGISERGVAEQFSTEPPLSLYGTTKRASELLALEYGATYGFPVWINRCGVLAGAGQFGRADQGIFSFWIHSWLAGRPLKYIGFGGLGHQVRDCLHPADLVSALLKQMDEPLETDKPRVMNFAGGTGMSLAQLSRWCGERFGHRSVQGVSEVRAFDIPWLVLDSSLAERTWQWRPRHGLDSILNEIAAHAEANPEWLEITGS